MIELLRAVKKMNEYARSGKEGLISDVKDYYDTGSYLFNAQISRSIYKGFPGNRVVMIGGPNSSGKTYIMLNTVKTFLMTDSENVVLYYESEGALETSDLIFHDIPLDRFIHIPVKSLEHFKHQLTSIIAEIREERKDSHGRTVNPNNGSNVLVILDSLGMLYSEKELTDALSNKVVADVGSRAKITRSIFRTITLELNLLNIPAFITTHTFKNPMPFSGKTTGMSGGEGPQFSSSVVINLNVRKDYNKLIKKTTGVILTSIVDKSRLSKQYTKIPISIDYSSGMNKFYGLIDFALARGIFKKDGKSISVKGVRVKRTEIESNYEKYFDKEILDLIDLECEKYFKYGFDDTVIVSDDSTENDIGIDELEESKNDNIVSTSLSELELSEIDI